MRVTRQAYLVALVALLASFVMPIPATGQDWQPSIAEQNEAAAEVMAQLEAAGGGLALSEIDGIDQLGPMPWLSFTEARSAKAVEAWHAIAAQLPPEDLASARSAEALGDGLLFAESEAPEQTGINDTRETGDPIDGFGTGEGDERLVTITGNLSGAEVRPPIEGDCGSTEDDGSIPLANFTPASEIQIALCVGEIGDGPFGESSGDIDFYSFGEVEEGTILILDVFNISGSLQQVNSVIGIYDAEGNLLASEEDSGEGEGDTFIELIAPSAGEYFGAVVGCCDLPTDPFDSSTGAGSTEVGTYEVFVVAFPPPCVSEEDDGSIALANRTVVAEQGVDFCSGILGDGPHGDADGDFYAVGSVPEDFAVSYALFALEQPIEVVVGVYDVDGNLIDSTEIAANSSEAQIFTVEPDTPGDYYVAIAGCCDLPTDPTDPTSGTPSDQGGLYEIILQVSPAPCSSTEDDGSLALANPTFVPEGGSDFCGGEIGDGPHGDADTDFYSLGVAPVDQEIVVDVLTFEGPVETVVGIYNSAGELVASAEDSGNPEIEEFLSFAVEVEDEYFVAVAGCCELPADPTDPASGAPSDQAGSYNVGLAIQSPPCLSVEDDGSIDLANDASGVFGDEELFLIDCFGTVGDGPQADLNGDNDYFMTRELPAGRVLIADFFAFDEETAGAGELTIAVFNAAGDLINFGQDDPLTSGPDSDFFSVNIPEDGVYYFSFAGGLPSDPFDPGSGANTDIVSGYAVTIVDTTQEFLDGGFANWGQSFAASRVAAGQAEPPMRTAKAGPTTALLADLAARKAEAATITTAEEEPVVDVDFFLVELEKGDVISGGFDSSRLTGIIDPEGVERSVSGFNPSFAYPASSPLAHPRRNGFDHVATVDGVHAVFVAEGIGAYEGELRVIESGLASTDTADQQIIFLDFDGAEVSGDVFGTGVDATLSPLSDFLDGWGLSPSDEDAVIDATIDAVVETLDHDLRILDGRNGDRDASGTPTEFDVEILNSRDHGDLWGDPNVTRLVIGGTIDELQIATLGIAQSIDPGNLETEETAVTLLDLMSEPAGSPVSINSYGLADGVAKTDFVGFVLGHITAHEIGHLIGNWHQETFNEVDTLMDAGGDFPAIAGVGPDGIFGTADDTDPDFEEDIFNVFEGFSGVEDSAGRSAFALGTGQRLLGGGDPLADLTIELDGIAYPGEQLDLYGEFTGGVAPYTVSIDWGDGSLCPGAGTCFVDPDAGPTPGLVDADYTYSDSGVYTVTVTVTDFIGATVTASADTAACTIFGTAGADTIYGTPGDDVICGLGGNDRLFGRDGNDIIIGGSGRDRMDGGDGNDVMLGGSESDTMSGGNDMDTMSGGKGDDIMRGGNADDVMRGRLGNDRMFGQTGDDIMVGNRGNDRMYGGAGDDDMMGRRGNDQADGQQGDDTIAGGQDDDRIIGGRGDDDLSGDSGDDTVLGGVGDDDLNGGDDTDRCIGGPGTNTVIECEL